MLLHGWCDLAPTNTPPFLLRPSSWMNPNFRTLETLLESLSRRRRRRRRLAKEQEQPNDNKKKQGVCHIVALSFTLKSIYL
jgi:hypothetical protein